MDIPPAARFDRNNLFCVCSQFAGWSAGLLLCVHGGIVTEQNSQSRCEPSKGQGLLGNDATAKVARRFVLHCISKLIAVGFPFITSKSSFHLLKLLFWGGEKSPEETLKCLNHCLCQPLKDLSTHRDLEPQPTWSYVNPSQAFIYTHGFSLLIWVVFLTAVDALTRLRGKEVGLSRRRRGAAWAWRGSRKESLRNGASASLLCITVDMALAWGVIPPWRERCANEPEDVGRYW